MRTLLPAVAALIALVATCAQASVRPLEITGAPFELTVQEWTPPERDFPITAYGARPDGTLVTEAMDRAIAAAHAAGGGRVVVPDGEWRCGAFRLTNDVALVLSDRAVLRFPDDPVAVYRAPLRPDGLPTRTCSGLIQATGCTNVAVMGKGTIKCDVEYWHRNHQLNPQKGFPRPRLFVFNRCRNVRFEGFRIRGSPAWTMHFLICEDIVLRGVDAACTGPNTDGIDLESCNRALVEGCSLDQNDDGYCLKSGMNGYGRKRNIPTQNIVIRNCQVVHGTLLALGSEISGGVRNVYMTNCRVIDECIKWFSIKTNAKRGGFIENVLVENIVGNRSSRAVMEVEMFYDGNPNKELGKALEKKWLTRIGDLTIRNVACAEARWGVRINGDPERPPCRLRAENIRIGRIHDRLLDVKNAPDLAVKDVRIDPAAIREVFGLPPQVRPCDPEKDADPSVRFGWGDFREISDDEASRRVLEARIAAETATGRNCAPSVAPTDPKAASADDINPSVMAKFWDALARFGCALPGALVADDVRRVARASLDGVRLAIKPDAAREELTLTLANDSGRDLADLWVTAYLPFRYANRRRTFGVPRLAAGERLVRTFTFGAGINHMRHAAGRTPFAAAADFTRDGVRARLWATAEQPATEALLLPYKAARYLEPLDAGKVGDKVLAEISSGAGPLPAIGEWKSPFREGGAWWNVTAPSRPYTSEERALLASGRAVEVVALQFRSVDGAQVKARLTPLFPGRETAMYLNGERVKVTDKVVSLPARPGVNRLVVRCRCRPGERTACLQLATYTWAFSQLECVPFETPLSLFLLVGQSNMAGRGRIAAGDEIPCERIVKVLRDGTTAPATEPLHTDKKSAGAGLAMSFARAYADEHPNETVGLVPCAVGGSSIATWKPGEGKNYLAMLERVRAIRGRGTFVGILWHQGEANGHTRAEVDAYRGQLEEVIAGLRRDVADVPFVAGELGRYLAEFRKRGSDELDIPLWGEINRITREVCAATPRCDCVTSEGLTPNRDILHFDTPSLREFGLRYYAAWRLLAEGYRGSDSVRVVQGATAYNSWPMVQHVGERLICAYSRGSGHSIDEPRRGVFARTSTDGGLTWGDEATVVNDPAIGEVAEGAGADSKGAMLLWVRCWGKPADRRHELYRTVDGVRFERIARIVPEPFPMQIMRPTSVPGLGLVSLWFAGNYRKGGSNAWGMLVSADDGRTWENRIVERGLDVKEWPTEPSIVALGGDRLLIIARCEQRLGNQFQLTSTDNGRTWRKARTNIGDVSESTPALVFDPESRALCNYYYHRGARCLKRRTVDADFIFTRPTAWPEPEILARGHEERAYDAGNVTVSRSGATDFCAWYSGTKTRTAVVVTPVPVRGTR